MKGEALFQGELFQRVVGPAFPVGGAKGSDHVLAPFHQPLENSPAEGLLSVDDDTHLETSLFPHMPGAALPMA